MAVPSSGSLSMLDLAQECYYGTYGSGSITGPISMYDLINGGSTNGSGMSYPTINLNSDPNPAERFYLTLTDVFQVMGASNFEVYYNKSIGNASNLSVGDRLYLDCRLEIPYANADLYQAGSSATTTICSSGNYALFQTDSNGDISNVTCYST